MEKKEYDRREPRSFILVDANLMSAIIEKEDPEIIEDEVVKIMIHIVPSQDMIDFYNLDMNLDYPSGVISFPIQKNKLRTILADGTFGRKFLTTDIFDRAGKMTTLFKDMLSDYENLEKQYTTQKFLNSDLVEELRNYKLDLGKKLKEDEELWNIKKGGGEYSGNREEETAERD